MADRCEVEPAGPNDHERSTDHDVVDGHRGDRASHFREESIEPTTSIGEKPISSGAEARGDAEPVPVGFEPPVGALGKELDDLPAARSIGDRDDIARDIDDRFPSLALHIPTFAPERAPSHREDGRDVLHRTADLESASETGDLGVKSIGGHAIPEIEMRNAKT